VRYKPISEDDLQEVLKDSNLDPQAKDGIIKALILCQGQQQREQQQSPSNTGDSALQVLLQDRQQFVRDSIAQLSGRVDALDSKLTNCVDALGRELTSCVDALDSKLTSRVDALDSKLTSRADALDSKLNDLDSKLTNRADALDSKLNDLRTFLWVVVAAAGPMLAKDWYPLFSKLLP
jgi:hypothetical protein